MENFVTVRMRGEVRKDYMKKIMKEENDWDHNVKEDAVAGPLDCEAEMMQYQVH